MQNPGTGRASGAALRASRGRRWSAIAMSLALTIGLGFVDGSAPASAQAAVNTDALVRAGVAERVQQLAAASSGTSPSTVGGSAAAASVGSAAQTAKASATTVRIRSIGSSVDVTGKVPVKVSCVAKKACKGTVVVTVAGTKSKTVKFSLKAKKTKTVRVQLRPAQLQSMLTATGSKRSVKVTVKTSKPKKTTLSKSKTVKITAPLRLVSMPNQPTAGKVAVTLSCVSSKACKGSASLLVGGQTSAKVAVSIAAKKTKSYQLVLSAKQLQVLEGANGSALAAQVTVKLASPVSVTLTGAGKLALASDTGGGDDGTGGGDDHGEHGGNETSPYSVAYKSGASWTPSVYDSCTQAEHNSFAVVGPDGKLYPGWHPAVLKRANGSTCTFGHEHGDDPRGSDLYAWSMGQYAAEARAAGRSITQLASVAEACRYVDQVVCQYLGAGDVYLDVAAGKLLGLPFGYGSERLSEYWDAHPELTAVHRHEDDPGHKIVISNNQKLYEKNVNIMVPVFGQGQQQLECDFLMKMHQGSHSNDATKNNTHELMYAAKCNDGTEIFATTMTNYGNANELQSSCTRPFSANQPVATTIATVGSNLPQGEGGSRLIPTLDCVTKYTTNGTGAYATSGAGNGTTDDRRGSPQTANGWWWAGYEQWQAFVSIEDANGDELARYEPWFGVQNPARYYVSNNGVNSAGQPDTQIAYFNDLAWPNETQGSNQTQWEPWKSQAAKSADPIDPKSPDAWFNGAIRDAWITSPSLTNTSKKNYLYVDPWGKNASTEAFPGSIRVYLTVHSNNSYVTTTTPATLNRATISGQALTRAGATAPKSLTQFYDYSVDASGTSLGVHAPN